MKSEVIEDVLRQLEDIYDTLNSQNHDDCFSHSIDILDELIEEMQSKLD